MDFIVQDGILAQWPKPKLGGPRKLGAEVGAQMEAQIKWKSHNTRWTLEAYGCGIKWEFTNTCLVSFSSLRRDLLTHLFRSTSVVYLGGYGYGYVIIFYACMVVLILLFYHVWMLTIKIDN